MIETTIKIDNKEYVFVTENGKTELRISAQTSSVEDKKSLEKSVPNAWFVTRKTGELLFAIRPRTGDRIFKILTGDRLYKEYQSQWFEPLADNYQEILWVHPDSAVKGTAQFDAYKHFNWSNIVEFYRQQSFVATSFLQNGSGDWKKSEQGASGYLMCFIDGMPYWADAVGQIPFSIFAYRNECTKSVDTDHNICETVLWGMHFGSGHLSEFISDSSDHSDTYDNYFVLRGAVWASKNYKLSIGQGVNSYAAVSINIQDSMYDPQTLASSINVTQREKYGLWTK